MGMTYDLAVGAIRKIYDTRLAGPSVLDCAACFPAAAAFRDRWRAIAAEAGTVAEDILAVPRFHELMPDQACISANDDRDWRMFVLKAYDVPIPGNLERCPQLATLLAGTPEVVSAAFSFLAPGKHVPRHRGPFRGIMRFHLMLSMPAAGDGTPSSVLAIEDAEFRLGEGECLLWDDTFAHEVWNRGERIRTALLLDVRRPAMPWDLSLLSRLLISVVGLSIRWRRTALTKATCPPSAAGRTGTTGPACPHLRRPPRSVREG
jgi:aspartate beta-hydroxylase